jgi:hypothetical protein
MISRLCLIVVTLLALAASAEAQSRPRAGACLDRLHRDGADLPAASRQARSTLIANPGRIDAVAARAARAGARERTEIELGIARAAEWLQCVDPYGYKALSDYLRAHPADPVVADLDRALNARAAVGAQSASADASEGAAANAGGANPGNASGADAPALGGPSFAAAGPIVSPSH